MADRALGNPLGNPLGLAKKKAAIAPVVIYLKGPLTGRYMIDGTQSAFRVTVIGAGGGATYFAGGNGNGGGGGGLSQSAIIPAQGRVSIDYVIAGPGAPSTDGGDTSATFSGVKLLATGGKRGGAAQGNPYGSNGGLGGVGSGGLKNHTGGKGGSGGGGASGVDDDGDPGGFNGGGAPSSSTVNSPTTAGGGGANYQCGGGGSGCRGAGAGSLKNNVGMVVIGSSGIQAGTGDGGDGGGGGSCYIDTSKGGCGMLRIELW